MPLTIPQKQAVDARNPSVLISAAAGSGKTKVLIDRVLSLMKEGIPLERMLIVTFTRAAAGEMRERLTTEMEKSTDAGIRRQIMSLNRAYICTIDVFCKRLIETHFQAAGVDAQARIGDQSVLDHLLQKATETVLENAYADPTPDEDILFENYTSDQVQEAVEETRSFMLSLIEPEGWADQAGNSEDPTPFLHLLQDECLLLLSGAEAFLHECDVLLDQPGGPQRYNDTYKQDVETLSNIRNAIKNDSYVPGLFSFCRISAKRKGFEDDDPDLVLRYQMLRKNMKDLVSKIDKSYPTNIEEAVQEIQFTLPSIRAITRLALGVQELYDHYKRKKNLMDFSDLSRLSVKILKDEKLRKKAEECFDAVFVDECQDVSAVQDFIIHSVVGKKTLFFMVGDVKQSIYRFRQASPQLFQHNYNTFSDDPEAEDRRIILQHNFRSDKNILECINHIFSYCMRSRVTELDYDAAARLYPPENAMEGTETELLLLTNDLDEPQLPEDSSQENEEGELEGVGEELSFGYRYEAACIAKRINEMVGKQEIWDNGQPRLLRYRDIVILLRTASQKAPVMARILSAAGIPVFSDADDRYYDLPEIRDIISLLQVLDNPYQDIPLLAALHCPCFDFSYKELAQIRMKNKSGRVFFYEVFFGYDKEDALGEKIHRCKEKLEEWRFMASQLPLSAFLWQLMLSSGLYVRAGARPDGESRQANMRLLADQAGQLDHPMDLHTYLQNVHTRINTGSSPSARTIGENDDVVHIMTMHKSKGLQFPVVFLGELSHQFHGDRALLINDSQLGCDLQWVDAENRLKKTTLRRKAFLYKKKKEHLADDCRLLYVAMTRAKNRLILLASPKDIDKLREKASVPLSDCSVYQAGCMLDWIAAPLYNALQTGEDTRYQDSDGGKWHIRYIPCSELNIVSVPTASSLDEEEITVSEEIRWYMQRKNRLQAPLKLSVSSLSHPLKDEEDMEETPQTKRRITVKETKPRFMEEQVAFTGAEKGTIMHKVLGCIDYSLVRSGKINNALDELVKKGLLSDNEREIVRTTHLYNFFSSPLGKRVLSADLVHREWPFNLQLKNDTLLQGVIDLCFVENGAWILVDYKTDHLPTDELREHYGQQINWYRTALERITGRPVREMFLFSLPLGKEVPVKACDENIKELL